MALGPPPRICCQSHASSDPENRVGAGACCLPQKMPQETPQSQERRNSRSQFSQEHLCPITREEQSTLEMRMWGRNMSVIQPTRRPQLLLRATAFRAPWSHSVTWVPSGNTPGYPQSHTARGLNFDNAPVSVGSLQTRLRV